jgi:hypothetical protein
MMVHNAYLLKKVGFSASMLSAAFHIKKYAPKRVFIASGVHRICQITSGPHYPLNELGLQKIFLRRFHNSFRSSGGIAGHENLFYLHQIVHFIKVFLSNPANQKIFIGMFPVLRYNYNCIMRSCPRVMNKRRRSVGRVYEREKTKHVIY